MSEKPRGTIGIMTFHWAANYGAVLQSWALQKYLQNCGYSAEIINYVPGNLKVTLPRCFMTRHINTMKLRFKEFNRDRMIREFRYKHLNLSEVEYNDKEQLRKFPPVYDYYISGSDQIWNPYFTMGGQGGVTLSYYLDFAPSGKRRIAFSSSFGCKSLEENVGQTILPELKKFHSLSTREAEGVEIMRRLGLDAVNTIDPTLLLTASDYSSLIKAKSEKHRNLYVYILHGQRKYVEDLVDFVKDKKGLNVCDDDELTVEDWLDHIRSADYVITNSFHSVVFCLLFHTPFYAVDVHGKDMSSRITTLLGKVGLENRFLKLPISLDKIRMDDITDIQWANVDERLDSLRTISGNYLSAALEYSERVDDVPGSQCTGCGLCSVICPKSCISIEEDTQGYFKPVIDETACVHCGLCLKECVATNRPLALNGDIKSTHACWNKNESVRNESSSGGVFTELAETVLQHKGVVYGACYTAPMMVEHRAVSEAAELGKLRGSKYQQSKAWLVFKEIKKAIENGSDVLFSGTPCQVAALKRYIGVSDHLICVDIACHGVPSIRVLRDKCSTFGQNKVAYVNFRDKKTGWKDYSCLYYDSNGNLISDEIASESDFMRGYLANVYIRESCEDCYFAGIPRVGDISLADCWTKVHDGSSDNKGVTAVLINTEKGSKLFEEARKNLIIEDVTLEYVLKGTPTLAKGSKPSNLRERFWYGYERDGYKKTMYRFFGRAILKRKVLRAVKK